MSVLGGPAGERAAAGDFSGANSWFTWAGGENAQVLPNAIFLLATGVVVSAEGAVGFPPFLPCPVVALI